MYKNYDNSLMNTVSMTPTQKNKYKKYDLHYLKQLKNFHEMQELKAKNIHFHNQMMKRNTIANYKNEIDRINGEMNKSKLKGITIESLKMRKEALEKMIKDELNK